MTITVLIVDDHAILRHSLSALLAEEPDIEVVGQAAEGRTATQLVAQHHPDVVLMDVAMPTLNGIHATQQIKSHYAETKIVALSMYADEGYVMQMLQAGVSGYVLKQADSFEVVRAIRAAVTAEPFFTPQVSKAILQTYQQRASSSGVPVDLARLTPRECEVLQLLAEGESNQAIADQLGISVKTVEAHRANMMLKLEARNKTDLIRYAMRQGWVACE
jgi:DNA-binding NarL/FixJ family response regulator